jgi:hypothetical protein
VEKLIIDIAGWTAMVMILVAYLLITSNKVDSKSQLFQWLNLLGAILFVINLCHYKAWPSASLNAIWALIAIYGLCGIYRKDKE